MYMTSTTVVWGVATCNLVDVYRRFGRTCYLHLQATWSHVPEASALHDHYREKFRSLRICLIHLDLKDLLPEGPLIASLLNRALSLASLSIF
jgi:hypothetical protein